MEHPHRNPAKPESRAGVVTVRSATVDDLDRIRAIEQTGPGAPWSARSIAEELGRERAVHLVAVDAFGTFLGFIFAAAAADELNIHYLAVHPRFRRRGIATMLLTAALDMAKARGVRSVYLEVRSKNRPAIALYRQCGFAEHSKRKRYFADDNDDAIVMTMRVGAISLKKL